MQLAIADFNRFWSIFPTFWLLVDFGKFFNFFSILAPYKINKMSQSLLSRTLVISCSEFRDKGIIPLVFSLRGNGEQDNCQRLTSPSLRTRVERFSWLLSIFSCWKNSKHVKTTSKSCADAYKWTLTWWLPIFVIWGVTSVSPPQPS